MSGHSEKMRWTSQADLRVQVRKLWDSGQILASLVGGEPLFPRRLVLRRPTSSEIVEHFDEVRSWIRDLQGLPRCRVELRRSTHRVFGDNELPHEVWLESAQDAIALIGKETDAARFLELVHMTRERRPELLTWLADKPHWALELFGDWDSLLNVVDWMEAHPRPAVYVRQIDIPGIHTKFVENYSGILAELFDIVLPPAAIDAQISTTSSFTNRYGFLDKPLRVRFRILDPQCGLFNGASVEDVSLDAASFAWLEPKVSRIFHH